MIGAIKRLFERPEAIPILEKGCGSEDRLVRGLCYENALEIEKSEGDLFLRRALDEYDPAIRLMGIRALRAKMPDARYEEHLQKARSDRCPRVRQEAWRNYCEKYPKRWEAEIETALLDVNITISEEAQYAAKAAGKVNLREFYIKSAGQSEEDQLCAAIAGLGESGARADALLIERFLADPHAKIRAAALHAIAKLNASKYIGTFLAALNDGSRRVAREGVLALVKKVNLVGGEKLWGVFERCRDARRKRGVLFLIARLSQWESLPYLILGLGNPDESAAEASRRYRARLSARWNRSFVAPSREQAEKLRAVLSTHELLIGAAARRALEAYLKGI